jgi:hypothetical protein
MAVITTGAHPKALWPGVWGWFGAAYNEHEKQYPAIFDIESSNKNFEQVVEITGFGLAPAKAEGSATSYDSHTQGVTTTFTNVAYSLGYIVTREELADCKYAEVSRSRATSLAFSMNQTRENVGANVLNRFTNTAYVGGDGSALGVTDHGSLSGNQSNILSTAADLSESSLEDLTIQIMDAVNAKGLNIAIRPKRLIVPNELVYDAQRILKSSLRVDTANNDLNAIKSLGVIPEVAINTYLTDADAWFIKTNCPKGLLWFDREAVQFTKDQDFDTDNAKAKAYMRFVPGWGDWRGVFGSTGA